MRRLNLSISLACICVTAYGCASPTAGEGETQTQVGSEAQSLHKGKLLALGDSIAFGYSPFGDFTNASNFEGYPEMLASDFKVKNASCPGETSASFMSLTAPDNGCRAYRAQYPLHVKYGKKKTQLEYALKRLQNVDDGEDSNPDDKGVPTLVTLNIAGNDIFVLQAKCATDPNPAACFGAGAGAMIQSLAQNVGTILGTIRGTGYQGRLVYMNLYAGDYNDPNTVGLVNAINGATAQAAAATGAQVADAFNAFRTAAGTQSPCAAGLLIAKPTGGCDVHPTAEGQDILAQSVRDAH